MRATTVAVCMAFAAMTATVSESAEKDNGIPEVARPEVARAVEEAARRPHPRLFADADGFAALKARLGKEEFLTAGAEFIRATADPILKAKPCERIKEGKRLLGVSRTALYRINTLALAYRLYGNKDPLVPLAPRVGGREEGKVRNAETELTGKKKNRIIYVQQPKKGRSPWQQEKHSMESRMREIRTYGLTRGKSHRRQRRGVGLYSTFAPQLRQFA